MSAVMSTVRKPMPAELEPRPQFSCQPREILTGNAALLMVVE